MISWNWRIGCGVAPKDHAEDLRGDAAEVLGTSVQNVVGAEDAGLVSGR